MPTALDRVQCLLQPDVFAQIRTLAKHNKRSHSAMCAELIEAALKTAEYKQQLEEAPIQVPPREDPRQYAPQTQLRDEAVAAAVQGVDLNDAKLKKLLKLVELLDD